MTARQPFSAFRRSASNRGVGSAADPFVLDCPDGQLQSRYTLAVASPTIIDAVRLAGGLIIDRALAGWDVSVYAPRCKDSRALRVLGARACELDVLTDSSWTWPTALIMAASLCSADPLLSHMVQSAPSLHRTTIAYSGLDSVACGGDQSAVIHDLSAAAQVFKSHALAAAGVAGQTPAARERFHLALP